MDFLGQCLSLVEGPYCYMYVLVVPRGDGIEPGRYEYNWSIDGQEMAEVINWLRDPLEQDGRHNLWFYSCSEKCHLIYDRHEIIYLYGPTDRYESLLESLDFPEQYVQEWGSHVHFCNKEFDHIQDETVKSSDYKYHELGKEDLL